MGYLYRFEEHHPKNQNTVWLLSWVHTYSNIHKHRVALRSLYELIDSYLWRLELRIKIYKFTWQVQNRKASTVLQNKTSVWLKGLCCTLSNTIAPFWASQHWEQCAYFTSSQWAPFAFIIKVLTGVGASQVHQRFSESAVIPPCMFQALPSLTFLASGAHWCFRWLSTGSLWPNK